MCALSPLVGALSVTSEPEAMSIWAYLLPLPVSRKLTSDPETMALPLTLMPLPSRMYSPGSNTTSPPEMSMPPQ